MKITNYNNKEIKVTMECYNHKYYIIIIFPGLIFLSKNTGKTLKNAEIIK